MLKDVERQWRQMTAAHTTVHCSVLQHLITDKMLITGSFLRNISYESKAMVASRRALPSAL
ncbi:hypothetical protein E2C01_001174 [Portunus trituberculatus]|uniref:Uncharacterized protein n=1 Tax=Portunus trituberculatus TaxID=210409 RepID=A0A5B7CGJ3_PORTR|nr:hypothetical protein [Portunus trituberculatus]